MIRKSLFWGLTIVLVAALVSLIVRGRQMEKRQAEQSAEMVGHSQASAIKVLRPDDLVVMDSTMQQESNGNVLHEIEICNNGNTSYSGLSLSFVYMDQSGKVLVTRTAFLDGVTLSAGSLYAARNIELKEIPAAATRVQVSVLSADMLASQ